MEAVACFSFQPQHTVSRESSVAQTFKNPAEAPQIREGCFGFGERLMHVESFLDQHMK
jgi:hypothetical protein